MVEPYPVPSEYIHFDYVVYMVTTNQREDVGL